ncbi:hypothetical protein [Nonomuraea sp. CA-141351]|uniref:hypothetical protein n=1 Tax=Nonomuraea sp. CA-141351 TaxID=3239996 RepID=UPI003D93FBF4
MPVLRADHAPVRYRTEVFAWLNTFMWTGYGLGTAIAGHRAGPGNGTAAFGTSAAAALTGAILAIAAKHSTPPTRCRPRDNPPAMSTPRPIVPDR